tara:strand:+ start:6704 stop:7480 length:777 start_codon:yes stop_codon:yes gene_type:complete
MALTNKTIASTYGDILQADNNGSGRTANGTVIKDGLGQSTALTLGQNKTHIKPSSDQTDAFIVETSGGTDLLTVDTTNSAVKTGTTQTYANTQIQRFSVYDAQPTADTHTSMMVDSGAVFTIPITFGTGTDPATTYSLSASETNAMGLTMSSWYIPAAITIDEVRVIAGGEASDTLNFHLFSYTMASGTGSGAGDLSDGTLLAHNGSTLTTGDDRVTTTTLTIDSANVAADKVVIATFENVGATTDIAAQLIVKYHYQ